MYVRVSVCVFYRVCNSVIKNADYNLIFITLEFYKQNLFEEVDIAVVSFLFS